MTDNVIIKALECLMHDNCEDCADRIKDPIELSKYALDLINRKQAEIERLKSMNQAKLDTIHDLQAEIEQWKEEANKYQKLWCIAVDDIETAKSEAIQEFADKLNDRIINFPSAYPVENATLYFLNGSSHRQLEILEIIDKLVKEIAGDDK